MNRMGISARATRGRALTVIGLSTLLSALVLPQPAGAAPQGDPTCVAHAPACWDQLVPQAPTITYDAIATPGQTMTFTFTIAQDSGTPINTFRYGWSSPPTTEVVAAGTATRTATVSLTVPYFGLNTLWVRAVDAAGNLGNLASAEFQADPPAPAVGRWSLETPTGGSTVQALADLQAGARDLAATNVDWNNDVHFIGGQSATFNGATSVAQTSVPVVDTSNSFSVAAWVRLTSTSANQVVATQYGGAGTATNPFYLSFDAASGRWVFQGRRVNANAIARASGPIAKLGVWTHLAGVYNSADHKLRIYVNGVLAGESASYVSWNAPGEFWVGANTTGADHFAGQITDLLVYDRVLLAQDFTGQEASDPSSGGFDEPSIMAPIQVGDWPFAGAVPCLDPSQPGQCQAPNSGPLPYRLALTQGADVGAGHSGDALLLDATYDMGDPSDPNYGSTTHEHGWSQVNVGSARRPVWQDSPLIHTGQSFTVSAWARVDQDTGTSQLLFEQGGSANNQPAVMVGYDPARGWFFDQSTNQSATPTVQHINAAASAELGVWTQIAVVYDDYTAISRLYIDGTKQAEQSGIVTWDGLTPFYLGGDPELPGGADMQWHGGIDDVSVFQGAMTDPQVKALYDSQPGD